MAKRRRDQLLKQPRPHRAVAAAFWMPLHANPKVGGWVHDRLDQPIARGGGNIEFTSRSQRLMMTAVDITPTDRSADLMATAGRMVFGSLQRVRKMLIQFAARFEAHELHA
jgi:hypothetical protein